MPWLRIDDLFTEHPKIIGLSDKAFRLHLTMMCYCARYRTKGVMPAAAIREAKERLSARLGSVRALVSAGLWVETESGYVIHDFEKYNPLDPTKADRQARWRARRNASVDTDVDGNVDTDVDGDVDDPVLNPSLKDSPTPRAGLTTREQARAVPCLVCGAQPGKPCTGARGKEREGCHAERHAAAIAAGAPPLRDDTHPHVDVHLAASRWIAGHGWDETFTEDMVLEEFGRLARNAHAPELDTGQRDELLEQWRTVRAERYEAAEV